eukprot:366208-Chlamydomonas_euryale.AAC.5
MVSGARCARCPAHGKRGFELQTTNEPSAPQNTPSAKRLHTAEFLLASQTGGLKQGGENRQDGSFPQLPHVYQLELGLEGPPGT